ncbi:leucine-rich repeat domain-containing protein, partial [bacterium]|nr:leucine-rich repeat domain-containing protein [bacterium]
MKKLLMSLLLAGIGFVDLNGSQQMISRRHGQTKKISAPSLQLLCLQRLFKNKDHNKAKEILERLPESFFIKAPEQPSYSDISREILHLAMNKYTKLDLMPSPVWQFKKNNQELLVAFVERMNKVFILIFKKPYNLPLQGVQETFYTCTDIVIKNDDYKPVYTLSIQNMIDARLRIAVQNNKLDFRKLDLTSFDGFQNVLNLSELERLYFNNNQVEQLPPGIFNNLPALRVLYISHNQIKKLPSKIFDNLPSLQ